MPAISRFLGIVITIHSSDPEKKAVDGALATLDRDPRSGRPAEEVEAELRTRLRERHGA